MSDKTIFDFLHFNQPTEEQKIVLKAMASFVADENKNDFLILCGSAGTGKTSVTSALIGFLNHKKRGYKIAAPTGRAARILGRKSGSLASTIHSMIYTPKADGESGIVNFKLKIGHNSKPTVYIIDEASMISVNNNGDQSLFVTERGLLFDLIAYIKNANVLNKIIFLGDKYQLPPIGETTSMALNKDYLEKTFNLKGESFLLTEVKRQEDGSYILTNATEIRDAISQGRQSHPIAGTQNKSIYTASDKFVKEQKSEGPENSVAIGVSNKANDFFNKLVREKIFGRACKTLEVGDLLMVTNNWSRNGDVLYNGDHVELKHVDWNLQEQVAGLHFVAVRIKLLFSESNLEVEDYALVESLINIGGKIPSKLENELRKQRFIKNKIFRESQKPSDDRYVGALRLVYGNAITCNKAQGGEWKKVYINTLGIPSLKWQYTAVTRGIDSIEKF